MSVTTGLRENPALVQDVLESHFSLTNLPGLIDTVTFDGASGWTSPNPHPVLSLMRWTTSDDKVALEALTETISFFREKGRGFDWITGPESEHLVPHLQERGFLKPPLPVGAMVRALDWPVESPDLNGFDIVKWDDPDDLLPSDIMSAGFEVPDDVGAIYHKAYMQPTQLQRSDIYVAVDVQTSCPVAVGYLSYIGEGPSVLLRVSSTLEDYRGRGLYHALVQRRIADAARAGRRMAFVQAYSDDSRRALVDLGFECAGDMLLHRWRP
ncbi:MAG: hypothetical protein AAGL89_00020 [Pseudomonadota bacterium]